MSELVEKLIGQAFASASPIEANVAIERARVERGDELAPAVSYEVALPNLGPDEFLTSKVLPRLVYVLDCRGAGLSGATGVFVSLFTADRLYFIEASDVIAALAEARKLGLDEVKQRYGSNGTGDPLLLGGG
jgi:hypothetical protein